MIQELHIRIYRTTNKNYRAEVAAATGWSKVAGAPVKVHPLLAGIETLEEMFERIAFLYPDSGAPEVSILEAVRDIIRKDGAVCLVCRERVSKDLPTILDVRSLHMRSDLMRTIDAYAADYAAEGKLAKSRQDVEKQIGKNLSVINNAIASNFGRDAGSTGSEVANLRRSHFIALREVLAYAKETGVDWLCLVDAQRSLDADIIGED